MLRLNKISSGYAKLPVIQNLNLEIKPSSITTLIGLNGSGKSTLLKTIVGLVKPIAGTVFLEDKNLNEWTLGERAKKISFLESQSPVSFSMTVSELLQISARLQPQETQGSLMTEALKAVGLESFENRDLLKLSSGEVRRAFIAHTLCSGAQTILIDEPFSHLDWHHQLGLAESLVVWQKKYRTTFVLAVHELEWAAKISDQVCALHQGNLIAQDGPEKVFTQSEVCEVFAFKALIDENPIDRSRRLTLGRNARK